MATPPVARDRIGFHLPYTADFATYMAISLADTARRLGHSPTLLSCSPEVRPVHSGWDSKVLRYKADRFRPWAERCAHLVWFDVQPDKLQQAIDVGCQNTLVLLWHRVNDSVLPWLSKFHKVVCPHKAAHAVLSARWKQPLMDWVNWDPGNLPPTLPLPYAIPQRLLVMLDGAAIRTFAPMVLYGLQLLLARLPIEITVVTGRAWSHPAHLAYKSLAAYGHRPVRHLRRPSYEQRLSLYSSHQWVLSLEGEADVSWTALEALAAGVPVMAWRVAPHLDVVHDDYNGCLLPCRAEMSPLGVPHPVPDIHSFVAEVEAACRPAVLQARLAARPWVEVEARRNKFRAYWERQWQI